MVSIFIKLALEVHRYTDSTYIHVSPNHGELTSIHLVLYAHTHLYCVLLGDQYFVFSTGIAL
jgi:hypothetical protein